MTTEYAHAERIVARSCILFAKNLKSLTIFSKETSIEPMGFLYITSLISCSPCLRQGFPQGWRLMLLDCTTQCLAETISTTAVRAIPCGPAAFLRDVAMTMT